MIHKPLRGYVFREGLFFPAPAGRAMKFSALKGTRAGGAGGGRSAAEIITKKAKKHSNIEKKRKQYIVYTKFYFTK